MQFLIQHKNLNSMKTVLNLIFFLSFLPVVLAQESSGNRIIRSSLGSSGSSQTIVTSGGNYNISQSIGQNSVIGTYQSNGYYIRQGYQQPLSGKRKIKEKDDSLSAEVFPNPFHRQITIHFNTTILKHIAVSIYDVQGKIIYNQTFPPTQKLELYLNDIANGTYFLKVNSELQFFNTKLIKI